MPRTIWKGAITFGLVHIPVNLYPGSSDSALDLDLLDKRDFAPVGYRRINKRTGKEVGPRDIVKGYEYEKGEYVVVSDEDFKQANVKATQTVDIVAFVDATRIEPKFFDSPYYLEPGKRGEKGYALLRETLRKTGRVGIAQVVLRNRQHLAAVIPMGRLLLLNTLRYASEIRPVPKLSLPGETLRTVGVSAKEVQIATRLVEDMTEDWKAEAYKDTYRDDLLALIKRKVKSGRTHEVAPVGEGEAPRKTAEVIDLMSALKRSLNAKAGPEAAKRAPRQRAIRGGGSRARRSPVVERRRRRA